MAAISQKGAIRPIHPPPDLSRDGRLYSAAIDPEPAIQFQSRKCLLLPVIGLAIGLAVAGPAGSFPLFDHAAMMASGGMGVPAEALGE